MPDPGFRCIQYKPSSPPRATIFFISSFKSKAWYYQKVISTMTSCGFQVYAYDYHWKPLLDAYPQEWLEFSERVKDDISMKMLHEKNLDPARRFGIVGVSVGGTLALHAAKVLPDIERVMLVTIYGSMAQHISEHPLLDGTRQKCRELNLDTDKVRKILGYYEPLNRLDMLGGRKVLLFVNKADPVIPYSNTELLINEADKKGVRILVKTVDAPRHSLTIVKVFKRPGAWISFLTALQHPHYDSSYYDQSELQKNKKVKGSIYVTS